MDFRMEESLCLMHDFAVKCCPVLREYARQEMPGPLKFIWKIMSLHSVILMRYSCIKCAWLMPALNSGHLCIFLWAVNLML